MLNALALIVFLVLYIVLLQDDGLIYDVFKDVLNGFNAEHTVRRPKLVRGETYNGWILLWGGLFYALFRLDSADNKNIKYTHSVNHKD